MATFSGGAKLEAALAAIADKVKNPGTLRVGFLEGATYPDGTSVPLVAAMNEFGAPSRGQVPRPFFREMISEKSPRWGGQLGNLLKMHDYDATEALQAMGEGIADQLREKITTFEGAPLAQSTIDAKGFDKQLVNTGHMKNSVGKEIVGGS